MIFVLLLKPFMYLDLGIDKKVNISYHDDDDDNNNNNNNNSNNNNNDDELFHQMVDQKNSSKLLSANPAKWSNTLKQFVGFLPVCLTIL